MQYCIQEAFCEIGGEINLGLAFHSGNVAAKQGRGRDEELSTIEDKVADAIDAAGVDDGVDSAWGCVVQMIRLSEGIASEKMFARQLRRKFL